jgi:hypothetical protein
MVEDKNLTETEIMPRKRNTSKYLILEIKDGFMKIIKYL